MSNLTYVLIPVVIFGTYALLNWLLMRRTAKVRQDEIIDRVYRPSIWFWFSVVTLSLIVIGAIASFIQLEHSNWIEGLVVGLVVTSPITLVMLVSSIYCAARTRIEVKDGRIIYHNGFKQKDFSLRGIVSASLDGCFVFNIIHARNPEKPIRIGPVYKDFHLFIATCQQAAKK